MQLECPGARAVIDLVHGGRLASLTVDGVELLVTAGADQFHWGSFPMAPWVGRVRDGLFTFRERQVELPRNAPPHALHGLVTGIPWEAVGPGTLAVDVPDAWPWRARLVQEMRLEPDGLASRLELQASEPMPGAIGWHPWFVARPVRPNGTPIAPIELDVRPGSMYANDEADLPTGELIPPVPRPWDYCFTGLAASPMVRWPGFLELTIESSCTDWVIYDREAQGLCVEPWTAPPNAVNLPDPTVIEPGAPLVATMTWRGRRLEG